MYYVFECSMLQQCRSCASMIFICHRLLFQNGYILLTSQSGLSNWFQLTTFCSFIANGFCHCQWTLDIFVLPLTGFSLVAVFVPNLWKLHFEDNFRQNFCLGFTTAIRYKRMLHSMQMQLLLITNTFFVQTFDIVSVIMFVCDGYYFIKPFECTHTTEHLNQ